MLSDALRCMQAFSTQCLNKFSEDSTFTRENAALRLLILEFVEQQCSERVGA